MSHRPSFPAPGFPQGQARGWSCTRPGSQGPGRWRGSHRRRCRNCGGQRRRIDPAVRARFDVTRGRGSPPGASRCVHSNDRRHPSYLTTHGARPPQGRFRQSWGTQPPRPRRATPRCRRSALTSVLSVPDSSLLASPRTSAPAPGRIPQQLRWNSRHVTDVPRHSDLQRSPNPLSSLSGRVLILGDRLRSARPGSRAGQVLPRL